MTDERKDGGPAYPVWQPIETAPRDTIILGYGETAGEMSGRYHEKHIFPIIFSGDSDYEGFAWSIPSTDYAAMWMNPTHWMHQPPPPGSLSPIKESDTAIIAKLREALKAIVQTDQIREFMGDDKSDGYGDEGWVVRDGQYARTARAALTETEQAQAEGTEAGR